MARRSVAPTRFRILGADQVVAAFRRLDDAVSGELAAKALLAGAEIDRQKWSELTPKDMHYYERSITSAARAGDHGATAIVFPADVPGVPDKEQPRRYAARLEFGSMAQTKKMLKRGIAADKARARKPYPSARPAFDAAKDNMVGAIAEELRHSIEKAT